MFERRQRSQHRAQRRPHGAPRRTGLGGTARWSPHSCSGSCGGHTLFSRVTFSGRGFTPLTPRSNPIRPRSPAFQWFPGEAEWGCSVRGGPCWGRRWGWRWAPSAEHPAREVLRGPQTKLPCYPRPCVVLSWDKLARGAVTPEETRCIQGKSHRLPVILEFCSFTSFFVRVDDDGKRPVSHRLQLLFN